MNFLINWFQTLNFGACIQAIMMCQVCSHPFIDVSKSGFIINRSCRFFFNSFCFPCWLNHQNIFNIFFSILVLNSWRSFSICSANVILAPMQRSVSNPGFAYLGTLVSASHLQYMSILLVSSLEASSLSGWLTSPWPLIFTSWRVHSAQQWQREMKQACKNSQQAWMIASAAVKCGDLALYLAGEPVLSALSLEYRFENYIRLNSVCYRHKPEMSGFAHRAGP